MHGRFARSQAQCKATMPQRSTDMRSELDILAGAHADRCCRAYNSLYRMQAMRGMRPDWSPQAGGMPMVVQPQALAGGRGGLQWYMPPPPGSDAGLCACLSVLVRCSCCALVLRCPRSDLRRVQLSEGPRRAASELATIDADGVGPYVERL